MNVLAGKVTYAAVAEAHGLPYTPLEDVLAAGGLALLLLVRAGARADPDDAPGDGRRERDGADDEDREADQAENVRHEALG